VVISASRPRFMMHSSFSFSLLLALSIAVGAVGCATPRSALNLSPPLPTDDGLSCSLVVRPFRDLRGHRTNVVGPALCTVLPVISIVPWTMLYDRPDQESLTRWKTEEMGLSIARAMSESIKESGLFKTVSFQRSTIGPGGEYYEGDYYLEGEIHEARLEGTLYTYGLGTTVGVWLGFLGLPVAWYRVGIDITLKLVDARSSNPIWQDRLTYVHASPKMNLYYLIALRSDTNMLDLLFGMAVGIPWAESYPSFRQAVIKHSRQQRTHSLHPDSSGL